MAMDRSPNDVLPLLHCLLAVCVLAVVLPTAAGVAAGAPAAATVGADEAGVERSTPAVGVDGVAVAELGGATTAAASRERRVDLSFDPATTDGNTTMTITSDGADEFVLRADRISATQFDDAIDGGTVRDGEFVLSRDGDVSVDSRYFSDYEHEITAAVADGDAAATANLIAQKRSLPIRLSAADATAQVGDVVEFDVEGSEELWVTIEDERGAYDVTFNVSVPRRYDDPVEVRWDTRRALDDATAGLSAEGGDIGTVRTDGRYFDQDHLDEVEHSFELSVYRYENKIQYDRYEERSVVTLRPPQHDLDLSLDPATAVDSTTIQVTSNPSDADVALRSETISASVLDHAIDGGTVRDGEFVLAGSGPVPVDTRYLPAGEHEIRAALANGDAAATATLEVLQVASSPEFAERTATGRVGGVVEFDVATQHRSRELWVAIEDDRGRYDVAFNLTAFEDSDEPVEVRWDTRRALEASTAGLSAENAEIGTVRTDGAYFSHDRLLGVEHSFQRSLYVSESNVGTDAVVDLGSVELRPPSPDGLRTWSVRSGHDLPTNASELSTVLADATPNATVPHENLLVVEVQGLSPLPDWNGTPAGFATDGRELEFEPPMWYFGNNPEKYVDDPELAGNVSIVDGLDDADDPRSSNAPATPRADAVYVAVQAGAIEIWTDPVEWDAAFTIDGSENPYVRSGTTETVREPFTIQKGTVAAEGTAPAQLAVGERDALRATVVNGGEANDTAEVVVEIGGTVVAERAVELAPGERWSESFAIDTVEADAQEWSVTTQHDRAEGTVRVYEPIEIAAPAAAESDGFAASPYDGSDLYYDVTGDGSVGYADVLAFVTSGNREAWEQPAYFDFDGDGDVGSGDAVELLRLVATGGVAADH